MMLLLLLLLQIPPVLFLRCRAWVGCNVKTVKEVLLGVHGCGECLVVCPGVWVCCMVEGCGACGEEVMVLGLGCAGVVGCVFVCGLVLVGGVE